MENLRESEVKSKNNLSYVVSYLIPGEEFSKINLEATADTYAQICRAWLIQFLPNHPQYLNALEVLKQHEDADCLTFLEQIDFQKEILIDFSSKNRHLWEYFCPAAKIAQENPEIFAELLSEKRQLKNLKKAKFQLTQPESELLLSSNILISPPIDTNSKNIPPQFLQEALNFSKKEQSYWYDHPIPIDASIEENELLYGLQKLDEAVDFEKKMGIIKPYAKISMILSISVTHIGMEDLAERYVVDLINKNLEIKNLELYLFNEIRCKNIISAICPNEEKASSIFGVNGSYGRHFSFLKAMLALWNKAINSNTKFTFKIDLDQVFDQDFLMSQTGKTAIQLLCNPYWGGSATDSNGNMVDLGMIAGGLINQSDASKGIFIPDVKRPNTEEILSHISSKRVFCSQLPQSISTEAEIGCQRSDFQRVHVTGGTTGICLESLIKWRPFTPTFINRAEDQAFALSAFKENMYLSHLHAPGLIMRHDKDTFAGRAISNAANSKAIGDIERILLFSNYTNILSVERSKVSEHVWPFTSSFISENPEVLAGLIFALDGANIGADYVAEGSKRLLSTKRFCRTEIKTQLNREIEGWNLYYDNLANLSQNSLRYLTKTIEASAI